MRSAFSSRALSCWAAVRGISRTSVLVIVPGEDLLLIPTSPRWGPAAEFVPTYAGRPGDPIFRIPSCLRSPEHKLRLSTGSAPGQTFPSPYVEGHDATRLVPRGAALIVAWNEAASGRAGRGSV